MRCAILVNFLLFVAGPFTTGVNARSDAATVTEAVLTSFDPLEALLAADSNNGNDTQQVEQRGNLQVFTSSSSSSNNNNNDHDASVLGLCHLTALLPLARFNQQGGWDPFTSIGSLEGYAAILLAAHHLNTGNGSIVPEVQDLPDRCPIRFTTEIFDTQLDERVAMDHVIRLVERQNQWISGATSPSSSQPPPCAILGAYRSAVSMPTSIVTGLKGYPQFSALSTSSKLDDPEQFPLFGRFNPSDDGTAAAAILYYRHVLGVRHVGVLYANDAYGNAFVDGLVDAAAKLAPDMKLVSVPIPFDLSKAAPDTVPRIVAELKATGFKYFFGIIFDTVHFDPLMKQAFQQGIAGTGEHHWLFSDGVGVARIVNRVYEKDSPLYLATRGTGMITAVGGLPGMLAYDKLASALGSLRNPEDLAYIKSKLPKYETETNLGLLDVVDNIMESPGVIAPFMYDSVVALGLSACQLATANSDLSLDGPAHFKQTLKSSFQGASGKIAMNNITGTRLASSAMFSITNFADRASTRSVSENSNPRMGAVVTHVFQEGNWTTLESYIFNDGSETPPPDLPPISVDHNYIAPAARALIVFFALTAMSGSVALGIWTKIHEKSNVVRSSQPIFLYLICVGTFLMGTSVLALAVDDQVLESKGCKAACLVFPWLVSLGFVITASALFTKTHRINRIVHQTNFRRIKVSAFDVLPPMIALVGTNVFILTLWTVVNPAEWLREITDVDDFDRPSESMGQCVYGDSWPYVVLLVFCDMGALVYACYEAYVARDISTEYAESEYIFKSMALVLLIFFVCIPVGILTKDSATAYNCAIAGFVCAVSLSFQVFIFIPKIKYHQQAAAERRASMSNVRQSARVFRRGASMGAPGLSVEEATNEFGIQVYNRRQRQHDLEAENQQLKEANRRLELKIAVLDIEKEAVEKSRSSLMQHLSAHSRGSPVEVVSEAESTITIDDIEPVDETHLEVAPF